MPDPDNPLLRLDHVSRRYGSEAAVDGVAFSAGAGEFVALLGPNGAGKTTLVQMITGLFPPDEGRLEVLGHDMAREPAAALRGVGVVFQAQTLDAELTVRRNLRFHAGLHGLARREADLRIDASLARFGLADRARTSVGALSGGNRRRLELARALLHRPRLLVMDEATVGLDPASREDLISHVLDLRAQGALVLWTTHLLDEAERADRILLLHRGRLVFDGPPAQARARAEAPTLAAAFAALTGA